MSYWAEWLPRADIRADSLVEANTGRTYFVGVTKHLWRWVLAKLISKNTYLIEIIEKSMHKKLGELGSYLTKLKAQLVSTDDN